MNVRGLEYRYPSGGFTLGPLTLEGPENRPWLVLGPSGSGKSTLLRLLGGAMLPTVGSIEGLDPRKHAAYLPQFPERALAGRNLAEDLAGNVRPGGEERVRLRRALEKAGLSGVPLSRRSRELSGGERRRVALALILLTQCQFWALDEPDAALDSRGSSRLIEVLDGCRESGRTLWIATHHADLYRALDPWVVVLESGQVVEAGEFADVLDRPEVQKALGIPDRLPRRLWAEVERRVQGGPEGGVSPERLGVLRSEVLEKPGLD